MLAARHKTPHHKVTRFIAIFLPIKRHQALLTRITAQASKEYRKSVIYISLFFHAGWGGLLFLEGVKCFLCCLSD
jgi:hypothetical protein